ncbi:MAG: DUF309 domain-containing protein [Ectothiorhodospiraceae bacterium]|nr:DUF309 domain-containing protein [Ectothiorhodospiraceae bacterium]MCH8503764.1 DUF309 domain-containing protein [Ectothiorhodospiraceae bacterium]
MTARSSEIRRPAPARPVLSAPRLTALPFPAYPYLPGVDPHPLTDPAGHGGVGDLVDVRDRAGRERCYAYGCDLFNHGYWWECHEAWEALWHGTGRRGAGGLALQALIQVANAHLKLRMGMPRAVERLTAMARDHARTALQEAPAPVPGLDLAGWVEANRRYLAGRLTAGDGDAAAFPYLVPAGNWPD